MFVVRSPINEQRITNNDRSVDITYFDGFNRNWFWLFERVLQVGLDAVLQSCADLVALLDA